MFDVLQAIRTLSLADEHNPVKRTGRFHFPSGNDLAGFHARDSLEISEQCDFEFELGGLRFPRYQSKDGSTPRNFLRRLTIEGVPRRLRRARRIWRR
jgi:DNA polymerase III alpha subunit